MSYLEFLDLNFVGGLGGNSGSFIFKFGVAMTWPRTLSIFDLFDVVLLPASSSDVGELALSSLPLKSVVPCVENVDS